VFGIIPEKYLNWPIFVSEVVWLALRVESGAGCSATGVLVLEYWVI
jgi:hypothetical protein